MNKTTTLIAAAAAAAAILIGGYLWINNDEKADKQAAIDTFNAFTEALMELDIPKAQSMARGEAHAELVLLAQLLNMSVNIKVKPSGKPQVDEFVYKDGELRAVSDGGKNLTVLRKTDGKWYVEELPSTLSKTIIPGVLKIEKISK